VRSTSVPDASKAMNFLIKAYLKSPLVRFHKWFCLQEDAADVFWPENLRSYCDGSATTEHSSQFLNFPTTCFSVRPSEKVEQALA
jgi:hypothetical protein